MPLCGIIRTSSKSAADFRESHISYSFNGSNMVAKVVKKKNNMKE